MKLKITAMILVLASNIITITLFPELEVTGVIVHGIGFTTAIIAMVLWRIEDDI